MFDLNNPRGLAFDANGALYVAEAGRGGEQTCFPGPGGQPESAGRTGSISRLGRGGQQRIVTGLASHASQGGFGALGPHDVVPLSGGRLNVTIGLGTDPAKRSTCMPIGKDFGWLARAHTNGNWQNRVDLAAFEVRANPDGGAPDSNPYGLLAPSRGPRDGDDGDDENDGDESDDNDHQGKAIIATDAGGNSLLSIGPGKSVRTLATFPSRSNSVRGTDSVPTSVARGPDGALYVGELTGFPFVPGTANVYRVTSGVAVPVLTGFSFITDIAFGRDGSLYVVEFASGPFLSGPGNLWRVNPAIPGGTRTLIATDLVAPTSVAVGADDALYVSNCGVFPAGVRTTDPPPCQAGRGGHVLRIRP